MLIDNVYILGIIIYVFLNPHLRLMRFKVCYLTFVRNSLANLQRRNYYNNLIGYRKYYDHG